MTWIWTTALGVWQTIALARKYTVSVRLCLRAKLFSEGGSHKAASTTVTFIGRASRPPSCLAASIAFCAPRCEAFRHRQSDPLSLLTFRVSSALALGCQAQPKRSADPLLLQAAKLNKLIEGLATADQIIPFPTDCAAGKFPQAACLVGREHLARP